MTPISPPRRQRLAVARALVVAHVCLLFINYKIAKINKHKQASATIYTLKHVAKNKKTTLTAY
jgi:hypothetical protein